MPLTCPLVPLIKIQMLCIGASDATECLHRYPDAGLGGDPLGHHPETHQSLTLSGCKQTHGGPGTLLNHIMNRLDKVNASWSCL